MNRYDTFDSITDMLRELSCDTLEVWHLFLHLSILGLVLPLISLLIKNLVFSHLLPNKQTWGLHVQDCSVTKRVISCTTVGIQNVIFPFLFWILGVKCKI